MFTCRICLRQYRSIRFSSDRISICGRCVHFLNKAPEVAQHAEARLAELLLRGMQRWALHDMSSTDAWRRDKALWTLGNLQAAHSKALPRWLNKLLAEQKNSGHDFKILRANRRGLLHHHRPLSWGYPANWSEVASRIRRLDNFQCLVCTKRDQALDVHHIVYTSNFGTHQQANLVSLCRPCHEAEHDRTFDVGEVEVEGEVTSISDPEPPQLPPQSPPVSLASSPPQLSQMGAKSLLSAAETESIKTIRGVSQQQRFCGHCRTLVTPKSRFLWVGQCPNCGCSI